MKGRREQEELKMYSRGRRRQAERLHEQKSEVLLTDVKEGLSIGLKSLLDG